MSLFRSTLFGTAAALIVVCGVTANSSEDIVKVAPKNCRVLLENDQVRVLESWTKPGEREPMHSHPAYIVYNLSDYKVRFMSPDGTATTVDAKQGQVGWFGALEHSVENVGSSESRALIIELKQSSSSGD
jgi:hypothetical protein